MGWALIMMAGFGVACGPAVAEPDPSGGGDGSSSGGGSTTGATMASSTGGAEDSPTMTSPVTTSGAGEDGSSSGGPAVFEPQDYEGIWVCETNGRTFGLFVDHYGGEQDVSGRVCVPLGDAPDPPEWQPCGDLSLHPIGGFAIFASVPASDGGEGWDVSAILGPAAGGDGLEGLMTGSNQEDGELVACKPWP